MKQLFLFLSSLFLLNIAFAQDTIHSIESADRVLVEVIEPKDYDKDSKVIIISKDKKVIIGIGTVEAEPFTSMPNGVLVTIDEIVGNFIIMPGDIVAPLNAENLRQYKVPGFNSITLYEGKKIPAEYKELAYFGVFTSEGHALGKKEFLISPFQIQYGLTDDVSVRVVNALWADGYLNLGAKVGVVRNKWAKITVNALGAYKVQSQDWIAQTGVVLTLPSNSKFQQHYMVNVTLDPQSDEAKRTKGLNLFESSEIRSVTEYITDSWDRVLFGPLYNVENQTLGGTLSYMWIWNTFHVSLGLGTKDVTNLEFSSDGYYYVYDLFWRF